MFRRLLKVFLPRRHRATWSLSRRLPRVYPRPPALLFLVFHFRLQKNSTKRTLQDEEEFKEKSKERGAHDDDASNYAYLSVFRRLVSSLS